MDVKRIQGIRMIKIITEWCEICNKETTHKIKYVHKTKPAHPDLNLHYCMAYKTGYEKQLTGRR